MPCARKQLKPNKQTGGSAKPKQHGGFKHSTTKTHPTLPAHPSTTKQHGGSPASDMVGAQINQKALTDVVPEACPLKGNMNSLNLYQPTGGARRSHRKSHRKSKRSHSKSHRKSHSKSKRSHRKSHRNNKKTMRGGGSDWIMSQYSQGNINAPETDMWKQFSASAPSGRNDLMNPPTLGLAGSGAPMSGLEGANVRTVGSPLV